MRKDLKSKRNSAKRFRPLSPTTLIVATAILAIGAITVVSRQGVGVKASGNEGRSAVAKNSGRNFVPSKVEGEAVQGQGLTPEEAQKMAAGLKQLINKSVEDRAQVQHPDGSVSIDLEDRFQSVTVAKVEEDGTLSQSCVDNPKAAGAFFGINPEMIRNESQRQPTRVNTVEPQN